jgi:predicted GNAT superfamily acetyltransferase
MEIRSLSRLEEFSQAEALQGQAWNCPDREIVPAHLLQAQAGHGGCVLGAWQESELVGLVYGFPTGLDYLYSHLAAVSPALQGRGLGERLKRAQGEWAQRKGLRRVVWTFDPLQVANARLNLNKLGAVGQRYKVNYYGPLDDELNRGVETDRLEVDWWQQPIQRGPVQQRIGFPWPLPAAERQHWRQQTRPQFQLALAQGLAAVGIELDSGQAQYLLAEVRT